MRDFRRLEVWRKAHELTLGVYRATAAFPKEERYGLTAHLRRTSSSIPTNLAEGCGRHGQRELAHFISIAAGSASELEYQLLLSRDLLFLASADHQRLDALTNEVKKMLNALHRRFTASKANS